MPITLVKGDSSLALFEQVVQSRLGAQQPYSFVVVVPTRRRIRELNRQFLLSVPNQTASAFLIFTLATLAHRLAAASLPLKRAVSPHVQAVLMERAIEAVADKLSFFSLGGESARTRRGIVPQGTFQKLIDVINGLREAGIYADELRNELNGAMLEEHRKLADVLRIVEAYEAELGGVFTDPAGEMRDVVAALSSQDPGTIWARAFPSYPDVLFIDGFDEFARPEFDFIRLLTRIKNLTVVLNFDFSPKNPELFYHLEDNYRDFVAIGFRPPEQAVRHHNDAPKSPSDIFRDHVATYLFRRGLDVPKLAAQDRVTILEARDREREVEMIARLIKSYIVTNPGVDISRICVATARSGVYTPLFRETFARYGIPANITDRYRLDASPLVVGILALLSVAENDFHRRDLLRALSSPYIRLGIDAANLASVSAELRIIAGAKQWREGIQARLSVVDDRLHEVDDEVERWTFEREHSMLVQALADLDQLEKLLSPFREPMTPLEFRNRLLHLLELLNIDVSKFTRGQDMMLGERWEDIERDGRAFATFLSVLDDVAALREMEGRGPTPLSTYLTELRAAVSRARYNIRQRYGYGVYVTTIEETRGLNFDVMFIAGLVDGEFPAPYEPEVFLSSQRMGVKRRRYLYQQRYLFYQGITNFTKHLYLSYPVAEGDLKELVPSSFIEAFRNIVEAEEWSRRLPEEIEHAIYSRDELLRRISVAMWRNNEHLLDDLYKELGERSIIDRTSLEHAFQVERSRAGLHTNREYEGYIFGSLSPELQETLARYGSCLYSVSQLETYALCPFKFFAQRVLGILPVKTVEEGVTPLERGSIIHEILFTFFTRWREQSPVVPLWRISDDEMHKASELLLQIAREKLDSINVISPFWEFEKEELLGSSWIKGVFQEFLEHERNRKDHLQPRFFEVSFGGKTGRHDRQLSHPEPIRMGDVLVRGKIDRIDVDESENVWVAFDYKTGAIPTLLSMREGTHLQLPIYVRALRELASRAGFSSDLHIGGAFYEVKRNSVKVHPVLVDNELRKKLGFRSSKVMTPDQHSALLEKAGEELQRLVKGITSGEFPLIVPDKVEKICLGCEYRMICRIWVLHQPISRDPRQQEQGLFYVGDNS
ncbi:MAG: PD-(D/E)XK nuclease family protein [Bacteroidota bacterium]